MRSRGAACGLPRLQQRSLRVSAELYYSEHRVRFKVLLFPPSRPTSQGGVQALLGMIVDSFFSIWIWVFLPSTGWVFTVRSWGFAPRGTPGVSSFSSRPHSEAGDCNVLRTCLSLSSLCAARAGLTRHGIESRLVLGVPGQKGPRFEAHAWLLSHGIAVTGGNVARYNAFPGA